MRSTGTYTSLAFAGAAPFLACALLPLAGVTAIAPFGTLDALAASYGLAIVCFLAGAHWATHLLRLAHVPYNLLISSNIVFLAVWVTFVMTGITWTLIVQVAAFIVLLLIDHRLAKAGILTADYFRVRGIATALAVLSLCLILIS